MADEIQKIRARILVKAYPQPSSKYEETVCVAAITEDGKRLLRLYPVRFRHLPEGQRFNRFDLIEANAWQDKRDGRPESYRLIEDSLQKVTNAPKLDVSDQVRLWAPFIKPSLPALKQERVDHKTTLGIVRPEPASVRFTYKRIERVSSDERAELKDLNHQFNLLDDSLTPLPEPRYAFRYEYQSGGAASKMKIHDWEVQTAFHKFVRRYGSDEEALRHLEGLYGDKFPKQNLHFIMGTMKAHPHQFIIIGCLRPKYGPAEATAQQSLF